MRASVILAMLCAGWLVLGAASVARADHPALLSSEPAAGTVMETAPGDVSLLFNTLLIEAESSMTVVDADGVTVSEESAQLDPTDHKMLRVPLRPELAPGEYTVTWSVVSAESGSDYSGSLSFTVAPAAAVSGATVARTGPGLAAPARSHRGRRDLALALTPAEEAYLRPRVVSLGDDR